MSLYVCYIEPSWAVLCLPMLCYALCYAKFNITSCWKERGVFFSGNSVRERRKVWAGNVVIQVKNSVWCSLGVAGWWKPVPHGVSSCVLTFFLTPLNWKCSLRVLSRLELVLLLRSLRRSSVSASAGHTGGATPEHLGSTGRSQEEKIGGLLLSCDSCPKTHWPMIFWGSVSGWTLQGVITGGSWG